MAGSFIAWMKKFNESNARRQIRNLERIKKYLEDKQLRLDDQIGIREKAIKYWFHTKKGHPFVVLDPTFGSRYVTKYEDYTQPQSHHNHNHNQYHNRNQHQQRGYGHQQQQQHSYQNPENVVQLDVLITNKELLRRIEFEWNKCTQSVRAGSDFGDFRRYALRGDWFCVAFEMANAQFEPEWVTLIATGNRSIYECRRRGHRLECVAKTNESMRLPADTVIDCIKTRGGAGAASEEEEIFHIVDAWVIGSKSLYKRSLIARQEFCRVLYQGYGSKYLKFAGAMPALQSLQRPCMARLATQGKCVIWFLRNKKTAEVKKDSQSAYWRPTSIKHWTPNHRECADFGQMMESLRRINETQMERRQKQRKK